MSFFDDAAIALSKRSGMMLDDAAKVVDDIGETQARQLADGWDEATSFLNSRGGQATLFAGATGGSLALIESENTEQARLSVQNQEQENDALASILAADDLTAEQKQRLVRDLQNGNNNASPAGETITDRVMDDPALYAIGAIVLIVAVRQATESIISGDQT